MSDLLKSIWDFLVFFRGYLNTLSPLQTLFCFGCLVLCALLIASAFHIGSSNPRRYPDEYVRTHTGQFYSWFVRHPEDKARYD